VKAKRNWLVPAIILAVILVCNTFPWLYTSAALNWARREGVYATPKEGVRARANRWFCDVERVNINLASTNSFEPIESPCKVRDLDSLRQKLLTLRRYVGPPLYNQTYQGGQFYLSKGRLGNDAGGFVSRIHRLLDESIQFGRSRLSDTHPSGIIALSAFKVSFHLSRNPIRIYKKTIGFTILIQIKGHKKPGLSCLKPGSIHCYSVRFTLSSSA
jgi:hypothetical protein